mmetsp:Transcript_9554/g.9159  ORF Transcript_9554/g.9159 Transcript_9554/m.9159 type:complete len:120 (-) Transcript_9554:957-1316(-)
MKNEEKESSLEEKKEEKKESNKEKTFKVIGKMSGDLHLFLKIIMQDLGYAKEALKSSIVTIFGGILKEISSTLVSLSSNYTFEGDVRLAFNRIQVLAVDLFQATFGVVSQAHSTIEKYE